LICEELEKYKKKDAGRTDAPEPVVDTEGIINDILKLEKIRRGRFLIE
jgi:hypothetical protein